MLRIGMLIMFVPLIIGTVSAEEKLPVFVEDIMRPMALKDRPAAVYAAEEVTLHVLRGELESFAVTVCNDGDKPLTIAGRIDALRAEGVQAATIPAAAVEIRGLAYGPTPVYKVKDWIVGTENRAAAEPGTNARLWITVHVPAEAVPGTYRGSLVVESAGRRQSLAVSLHVSPADHHPAAGKGFYLLSTVSAYGQYYRALDETRRTALRSAVVAFYRELKSYGMTGLAAKTNDFPYVEGDIQGLIAEVDAALEAGLDGPVVWNMMALIDAAKGGDRYDMNGRMDNWDEQKDLERLRKLHALASAAAEKRNWPEIIYYPIDEPGTQFDMRNFLELSMDILEKTAKIVTTLGSRCHSTVTECVDDKHNQAPRWSRYPDEMRALWDRSRPWLGIRNYGYGYPQGQTSLFREIEDARARGYAVWTYNNAAVMGSNRYCGRMYFGLWSWKMGIDGVTAWTYPGARTVQMELVREGIDDHGLLMQIAALVADKKGTEEARARAAEFLAHLKEAVKVDANGFTGDWAEVAQQSMEAVRLGAGWDSIDFRNLKPRLVSVLESLLE